MKKPAFEGRGRAGRPTLAPLLALLGLLGPLSAWATQFEAIDPAHSSLQFVVREMGVPVEGSFHKFSVRLHFDPAHPESSEATIDLDLASIDAGSDEANDEVAGKDWFDTRNFPQAHFASTALRSLGGSRYELRGRLTIKGHTRELQAPFTLSAQGTSSSIDGGFNLKRGDFDVGGGQWADESTVSNEIQVKFHFPLLPAR